jgi:hypothetical protein
MDPYEIVLDDDRIVRAVHVTSRLVSMVSLVSQKPKGFIALDFVPKGAFLPYPGKMIGNLSYDKFKAAYGKELSHEWAKGGPKHFGERTLLLGQYARASRRSSAHFINCAKQLGKPGNCGWGGAKIDQRLLSVYPDLGLTALAPRELYPGIRVTAKDGIQPGQELLLCGYGGNFWSRMEREAHCSFVIRPPVLNPYILAVLDETPREARVAKRGTKRARDD